ncbi:MAG: hypothetical protein J6J03_05360 [Tyzzerella sp.]|nr:hypothetical protein [Tyzzerella sp.]
MNYKTLQQLCDIVKRKCKITWSDTDTDTRVEEIVANADESMRHMLGMKGASADAFLEPGKTRTLFENYCMYDWDDMLEEFETNYRREILAVRHRYEVKNEKKASETV